jgi:hypothetical protein
MKSVIFWENAQQNQKSELLNIPNYQPLPQFIIRTIIIFSPISSVLAGGLIYSQIAMQASGSQDVALIFTSSLEDFPVSVASGSYAFLTVKTVYRLSCAIHKRED